MAKGTRSLDITPGLLSLHHLAINKHKHSPAETRVLERITGDQQMLLGRELKGRMFACAARNLCGLISYRTGNKKEAITIWKDTLTEDATNLNALQDLISTYKDLEDTTQAEEYRQRFQEATDDSLDEQKRKKRQARCLAEQAYADYCDLQTKTWDSSDARKRQAKTFEEALRLEPGFISGEERRDWLLYLGRAHEKLAHAFFRVGNISCQTESVKCAFTSLYECLKLSHDPMHKAQALCALGNTFSLTHYNRAFLETLKNAFPNEQEEITKSINEWYEEALKLDKENKVWILARMGISYRNAGKHTEALSAFDKSIKAADSLPHDNPMRKACRLAYDHRAMIYVKQSKDPHCQQKKALLEKAKEDTEKACKISDHRNPLTTSGEVHFLLAQLEEDDATKNQLLQTALIHFKEALESQDGQYDPNAHYKYAKVLLYKSNLLGAIGHYHQAFNLVQQEKGDTSVGFATKVAQELLSATFKYYGNTRNHEDLSTYASIYLQCTFSYLDDSTVEEVIKPILCRFSSELLSTLKYIIRKAARSQAEFIGRCLQYLEENNVQSTRRGTNVQPTRRELNELSFLFSDLNVPSKTDNATRPRTARNKDYDYDFYVIADQGSQKWVTKFLLPSMERPVASLKGYVRDRDSVLGRLKVKAEEEAMTKSCFILIIVSSGFAANRDCRMQSAMARECERSEVVTIEIEKAEFPLYLRPYYCFDFTSQSRFSQLVLYMMPKLSC